MKSLWAAVAVLLAAGGEAAAHRLDEYLQATRVSVARDHVSLEVDLTPGVSIAPSVIESLDADADHAIAPAEAEAYGRAVLSDLLVKLDGNPVAMTLMRIEIPTIDEMRNGLGTIRVHAAGSIEAGVGRRRLYVFNSHRPDTSVYMVNALVPDEGGVDIVSQSRDPRQREFQMEFTVTPRWAAYLLWLGLATAGFAVVLAGRKTKNEKRRAKNEERKTNREGV